MTRTRVAVVVALALAVLAGTAVLGRWERGRAVAETNRQIAALRAAVGPVFVGPRVNDFSLQPDASPPLECLRYTVGDDRYAIQLCWDLRGRLVEAYDERSGTARFWSLRWDPSAAAVVDDPAVVGRAIERLYRRAWVLTGDRPPQVPELRQLVGLPPRGA